MTDLGARVGRWAGGLIALLALGGCARGVSVGSAQSVSEPPPPANTLSARERAEGWKLLFDGKNLLTHWRAYKADTIGPAWRIVDGILTKTRPGDDIVSREQFGDFELAFDWKVSPRGNAGVFFRANESESKIYWTAPEFQIADDSLTPDSRNPLTAAGAAYGLYPAPRGVAKFAGHWNTSRIVARGSHVEHWMNGVKTIEYEAWSPDWKAKVAASKFSAYPNWGLARSGLIGIQGDHGGTLELRNIKIREIR
ncbi:MAG TPA: DUF1080 domain-containing protein [Gemmatimonadaceae bacterium]|nr:DUF1080 domain-containing protein [Gemmatimonadaceae bacterium]